MCNALVIALAFSPFGCTREPSACGRGLLMGLMVAASWKLHLAPATSYSHPGGLMAVSSYLGRVAQPLSWLTIDLWLALG